ncbi:MAG: hypothetical protein U0531_12745 [Dehalococcoidia bacterium]
MGPEPLEDDWTARGRQTPWAGRRAPIKATLLDQRRVAGLGNIYVDESLHAAGVHLERTREAWTEAEIVRLHGHPRGAGESDPPPGPSARHHVGGMGQKGAMQEQWQVYTADCHVTLADHRHEGARVRRGTHLCPSRQPAPAGPVRSSP